MAVTNSSPTLNYSDNHMTDPAVTLFSWNKSGNLRAGFTLATNLFRTFHQMGRSDVYICPYLDTLKLLWFKYESQTDWFNANDWFGLIWRWLIPFFWQYELSMIEFCSTLNESKRLCNRNKIVLQSKIISNVKKESRSFTCVGGPEAVALWLICGTFE